MKTTILQQRMTGAVQVRDLFASDAGLYVLQVSQFARYLNKSPAVWGPRRSASYQVSLDEPKEVGGELDQGRRCGASNSVSSYSEAAVGFGGDHSRPQGAWNMPMILSPDEVVQLLGCIPNIEHRTNILTTSYTARLLTSPRRFT